jgi:uncharacterized protein YbjT (DUF2867 family)
MILVAGSTGLVGGQICVDLAKTGKPVRALVRSTSNRAKISNSAAFDAGRKPRQGCALWGGKAFAIRSTRRRSSSE